MEIFGYLASVGTSLFFSLSSIAFTQAGRKVGSPTVNRVRLLMALGFVLLLHTILYGQPFPFDAAPERFLFMGISGFIGFVLGDAFLFQAYVMVGPRLALLVMSLAPVLTVLLAWIFLSEKLVPRDLIGIGIVLIGIMLVVSDRRGGNQPSLAQPGTRLYWIGIGCAVGGAVGQSVGLIFSKIGLAGDFPAISGNVIRLTSATIAMWLITLLMGQAVGTIRRVRENPSSLRLLALGALMGPVLAVSLGLYSVQHIPAGIASTLQSLMPIFMIPISFFFFNETPTRRGVLGTIIALLGSAVLFL